VHEDEHAAHGAGAVEEGAVGAGHGGEHGGGLVALLGQDQLGDVAGGGGPAAADRLVDAAEVHDAHGLVGGDVAADAAGAAGEAVRGGVEGGDQAVARERHAAVAAADGHALVAEGGPGDRPAAVDGADHVVVGDEDVVEEDLVELAHPRGHA